MRYLHAATTLLFPLLLGTCARAQTVPTHLQTGHVALDDKLSGMVTADDHALNASEANRLDNAVFLDARELDEYTVSHLPNAIHIGYQTINYSVLKDMAKNTPIVVYCTVGYRSERIANKLREKGYDEVYNLYGSLYAWKLAGYPIVDANGKPTERIHTYNKKWGSLVPDTIGEKVW